MLKLDSIHHVAIIVSDYEKSKAFYTEILGCEIKSEVYRSTRDSWKLDLAVGGLYQIELFSFPDPPSRVSRPEAAGLRHLAFAVENVEAARDVLVKSNLTVEPIRVDEFTGKKFFFFEDPDGLPLEIYELSSDI